jgi:hypothetical protein
LQGRTGGRSVVISSQFTLSLNVCVVHLCLWLYLLQLLVEAFSLLVMNFVVESCCLSSGDRRVQVCCYFYTRAHTLKHKKKKKTFAPVTRMVVVTRQFVTDYSVAD